MAQDACCNGNTCCVCRPDLHGPPPPLFKTLREWWKSLKKRIPINAYLFCYDCAWIVENAIPPTRVTKCWKHHMEEKNMIFTRELEDAVMSKENEEDRRKMEEACESVKRILTRAPKGRRAAVMATRAKYEQEDAC